MEGAGQIKPRESASRCRGIQGLSGFLAEGERACRDSFGTSENNSFQGQKKAGFLAKGLIRCYLRHHMGTLGGRPGLVQRVGRWLGALEAGLRQVQVEGCSTAASCLPNLPNERAIKGRGRRKPMCMCEGPSHFTGRAQICRVRVTKTLGHQPAWYLCPWIKNKVDQWLACLLPKQKPQSSDPQNPHKCQPDVEAHTSETGHPQSKLAIETHHSLQLWV